MFDFMRTRYNQDALNGLFSQHIADLLNSAYSTDAVMEQYRECVFDLLNGLVDNYNARHVNQQDKENFKECLCLASKLPATKRKKLFSDRNKH